MALLTPQNLVIALFIVVPGFVAVLIGMTVGVVEQEVSNGEILIVSLASSLLVDTLFLSSIQILGSSVESAGGITAVFFTPVFRGDRVILLLAWTLFVGGFYAGLIIWDVPYKIRERAWPLIRDDEVYRHPRQPWAGVLSSGERVRIRLTDGTYVRGWINEHSRAEKEKQIAIGSPEWYDIEKDEWLEWGETALFIDSEISEVVVTDDSDDESSS